MPIPKEATWEVTFLLWLMVSVVGIVSGIAIFFILRYIKKNDDHHEAMEKAIKDQSTKMSNHIGKMKEVADQMGKSSVEMERSNAQFQQKVNSELLAINRTTSQIKVDLSECNNQIASIKTKTDGIVKTVDAHHKSLSLSAKAMRRQSEQIDGIKTTVKKMNNNLVLVGQKKKKQS